MKQSNRYKILIWCNLLFLIGLLIIQVNWIFRAASLQEQLFSQKVSMALGRTTDCIMNDKKTYSDMKCCFAGSRPCSAGLYRIDETQKAKIDSILKSNLDFFDIDLSYDFEFIDCSKQGSNFDGLSGPKCYMRNLENTLDKSGLILKINFPGKTEFIIGQIGVPFIVSILLIALVTASFIITLRNYRREKILAGHTRNFVNNMVHEFKTPLANISFANNLIRKNYSESDEKINRYTGIIKDENTKLEEQTGKILGVAFSGENINLSDHSLNDILKDAAGDFRFIIEEKQGSLDLDLYDGNTSVKCDRGKLAAAISNIIDNAVKYSPDAPVISIKSYIAGNKVVAEISDKGSGMKKEHLKQIFDRYYRIPTGDVHNVRGFGLGLAYVRNVISSIEGTIKAESIPGQGSTFIISIPVMPKII
ncbi:MAG: HAMP domain-containing sensor histidine kinase [Bacteroidota bacterium]